MGEKKDRPLTVSFTASERALIERTADAFGISAAAAVRLLLRAGATTTNIPFTPQGDTTNE